MKTAVAIRHLAFEDLGLIEPWLKRRGWRIVTYDVGIDELWKIDLSQVDLLIVLGGPIGANDDALYPCLAEEVELIRQRLDSGRALLGICLGAQLMARALGAAVTPMDRKEIGFSPLSLTPQGGTSPLVHIGTHPVLHWHGDQFDLPTGSASLAVASACPNQAFMVSEHAMAWQFHLEVDASRIEQWLIGHACELQRAGIDIAALRAAAVTYRARTEKALDAVLVDWFTRMRL
jgi:GMP synthase (glutamine-hydrolysing)